MCLTPSFLSPTSVEVARALTTDAVIYRYSVVTWKGAAGGPAPVITSEPSTMARGETALLISGTDLGSATLTANTSAGPQTLDITNNTATDINFTVPVGIIGLYNATGITITVTTADGVDSSEVVPFTPAAGRSYYDMVSPQFSDPQLYMMNGFQGTPDPLTADQHEHDTSSGGIFLEPELTSEWKWDVEPTSNQTVSNNIIRAATGVRSASWNTEFVIPYVLTTPDPTLITSSGCTPAVTTDGDDGIRYMVITPDGDFPNATQVKAGQDSLGGAALADENNTVVASGVQTFTTVTSLSPDHVLLDIMPEIRC